MERKFKVGDDMIIKSYKRWSCTHQQTTNYLLISEETFVHFNGHLINATTGKQVPDYEIEGIMSLSSTNIFNTGHFVCDSMDKTMAHVDGIKYFYVVFSNGYKVICTSWEDFLTYVK